MNDEKDVARFGVGMPSFGRILFSPEQNSGGTIDDVLAESGLTDGETPDPAAAPDGGSGEADGGTNGGAQDNSGAEVDLGPKFGKVKVADLQAAWGRNKSNSQSAARIKKYEALLEKLDTDPSLQDDIMEAIASRDEDAPAPRGRKAAEDEEYDGTEEPDAALLQKNPVEYIRQLKQYQQAQLFEMKERLADQALEREERELKTEYKLDEGQIREIEKIALKYKDGRGDPLPLKTAYAIWNNPKLMQEQAKLKDQINARSSGIPGGRSSGILSRKKVSEMSETEREQAMIDEFYNAENKAK